MSALNILKKVQPLQPFKHPRTPNFVGHGTSEARNYLGSALVDPLKDKTKKQENSESMKKTAKCDELVARALRSRVPVKKNKYLDKIAASKGFNTIPNTTGLKTLSIKKPVKPGLMKEASFIRQKLREGGKLVSNSVDFLGGAKVHKYGLNKVRGAAHTEAYLKAKGIPEQREALRKSLSGLSQKNTNKVMKGYDKEVLKQKVAVGTIGAGAGVVVGGKLKSHIDRKLQEREALRYYQQRGML